MNSEYNALRAAAEDIAKGQQNGDSQFEVLGESYYRLSLPGLESTIEISRLSRKGEHLLGEMRVACAMPEASTVDGLIHFDSMNLTSPRVRSQRAQDLARKAKTNNEPWAKALEELGLRVLEAERAGTPAVKLATVARPSSDPAFSVDGFVFPRKHPTILFGDGGSGKSYFALYCLGRLALSGVKVGLFDWEMAGEDHRERLERMFGQRMPEISYCRCDRALVYECDRLANVIRKEKLDYVCLDSVAFASDGPPEAAEVAARYFKALRALGNVGSLHVAHISKSEGSEKKPFGSIFWHNGARSTWFVKASENDLGRSTLELGLFNRKTNHGALKRPLALRMDFSNGETAIENADIGDIGDLAEHMTVPQQMAAYLRGGACPQKQLAKAIGAKLDTVQKTVRRNPERFVKIGENIGLIQLPDTSADK